MNVCVIIYCGWRRVMVVKDDFEFICVSGNIESLARQIESYLNEDSSSEKWRLHGSPFVFEGWIHQYLFRKTMLCLQPNGEHK
jgi:hypothetical protein